MRTMLAAFAVLTLVPAAAHAAPSATTSAGATAAVGEPPTYTVEVVIQGLTPRRSNEAGHAVGWTSTWPYQPGLFTPETGLVALPLLEDNTHGLAHDVNDAGTVVGRSGYYAIDDPQRAVRWVDGEVEELAIDSLGMSDAIGINNHGHIVGTFVAASPTGPAQHAFFYSDETGVIDLTPEVGWGAVVEARDVNENGQVAGGYGSQPFRWQDGVLELLGVPEGFRTATVYAINDHGQVVGATRSPTGSLEQLVRYTDGVGWEILGGGGDTNRAYGINNEGTVVGEGRWGSGLVLAVVHFDGLGLFNLNELTEAGEWRLMRAQDIDEQGRILASAHNTLTGGFASVLLTPAAGPPPPPPPPPPETDTVTIAKAEYNVRKGTLAVEANGSDPSATLAAYVAATDELIGTLSGKNGRYKGQFSLPASPERITIRSNLGGSDTRDVQLK